MKPINKDEIYEHLNSFLKDKGIELKAGSYSNRIQQGCNLLTESINLSQQGLKRAKVEIDRNLDRMRQAIHEKTAPKPPRNPAPPPKTGRPGASASARKTTTRQKPAKSRR